MHMHSLGVGRATQAGECGWRARGVGRYSLSNTSAKTYRVYVRKRTRQIERRRQAAVSIRYRRGMDKTRHAPTRMMSARLVVDTCAAVASTFALSA